MVFSLALFASAAVHGTIQLPKVITSGMVLQAETPTLFGWTTGGAAVKVSWILPPYSLARSLLLTLPSSPQATLTDSTGKATSFSSVSGWDALRNNSWRIDMPAQAASFGAATFSLVEDAGSSSSGGSATGAPITLTNVLFGDVHLCSGKGVLF